MKKTDIDTIMSEPEEEETNTEDLSDLLDSLSVFTLSGSQIPTEKKTRALRNLIELSLPNVRRNR